MNSKKQSARDELSQELPKYLATANLKKLTPYTYVRFVEDLPPHIGAEWHAFADRKEHSIHISTRRPLELQKRCLAHEIAHMEIKYGSKPYLRWMEKFFHIAFWFIPFYGTREFGNELFVYTYGTTKILAKTNPELLGLHKTYTDALIRKNVPRVLRNIICKVSGLLILLGQRKGRVSPLYTHSK